jgi:hypothetical protein
MMSVLLDAFALIALLAEEPTADASLTRVAGAEGVALRKLATPLRRA